MGSRMRNSGSKFAKWNHRLQERRCVGGISGASDGVAPSIEGNAEVEFIIGLDHPKGLVRLGVSGGSNGEPFALRTHLGWIVLEPMVL